MRVSLSELFGIVAFCSVVAWCAAVVGFDNGLFWLAVGASGILSVVFVRVARSPRAHKFAVLVPFMSLAFCVMPIMSISVLVNATLLFLVGVFCAFRPPLKLKTLCIIVLICGELGLVAGTIPGIDRVREIVALREQYPLVNLESRLRYEKAPRVARQRSRANMSAAVAVTLTTIESEFDRNTWRRRQLEQLHSREYEHFVRATGFGIGRMMRPIAGRLNRPDLYDIRFNARPPLPEAVRRWGDWQAYWSAGKSGELEHLHTVSRNDFLDPDSFGAQIESGKTAGFVEHAFHYSPVGSMDNHEVYTLKKLELVSLHKFDEPRVYVLDHLPRMDQLASEDVPTRPLNQFESEALDQLWGNEDVIISSAEYEHRMLGALRAAKQCLDCHGVARGDLLGAFSYVLHRMDGARPDAVALND